VFHDQVEKVEEWAVEHSKLTHRDPIALAACAAMGVGMVGVLSGARCGVESVPAEWIRDVERSEELPGLARLVVEVLRRNE
jgi:ADP-ribosylglycohydrolase